MEIIKPRILVVDDEPADLRLVAHALKKIGYQILPAATAKEALRYARSKRRPDVLVLDVMLPDGNGLDVLQKIREIDDRLPVIFVTSNSDSGMAIQAMKLGALDYLAKPIQVAELRKIVERGVEIRRLTEKPVEMNVDAGSARSDAIIGRCTAMQEVYKAIGIVAAQDVTVLIRGESGTGKELVARALYQYSERVTGPFLAVNCAAIPETLLESELFGHERGSFTGADRKRIGKFEQCNGGTLFLDEIGDMSPVLQSKVLRVLQEKQFERVGGNETISADVRVIAATHRNLERMVADEQFRADLYYRLNGFSIHLPPLRDRAGDLEMLVEHFRRLGNRDLNKNVRAVSPAAMDVLRRYSWPGNIRELQNVIRQAILQTTGPVLLPDFLPSSVLGEAPQLRGNSTVDGGLDGLIEDCIKAGSPHLYEEIVGRVERRLLARVLQQSGGDKAEAARLLGIEPATARSNIIREILGEEAVTAAVPAARPDLRFPAGMTLRELEREAVRQALKRTGGSRKEAARLLGISGRTMQRRVKELDPS